MKINSSIGVNEQNHMTFGGADTVVLAEKHGTPLYVMDESIIRGNLSEFKCAIDKYYAGNGLVCYASKAFACKEMYRITADQDCGIDVASGGELHTAVSSGFPVGRIVFHGNNKAEWELELALRHGIKSIVVDNTEELELLARLCADGGKTANITLRLKPGVKADTHKFIRTGAIDSKFGFGIASGDAMKAVKSALAHKELNLMGIHCHIGSQIFDTAPFGEAAKVMLEFIAKVKAETGHLIKELNLGGGFGIAYTDEDKPCEYDSYMKATAERIAQVCGDLNIPIPYIIIEPGRSIAAPAGITLYTAGVIKQIPDVRTYVIIDGGITDNPRYELYGAKYDIINASRANLPKTERITLAGKACESGDLIGEDMPVQTIEKGDIIAVLSTGAYNYSMSSNYNRIPKPAVVTVKDGQSKLIVKRETLDDIVRNDL
ncbi:MAG: diaminopimelate decarboxylase [Oscillospiraceae bacterium]|nr:diaminopimelate decarboxylase [Oscillospiraceae bacterium]